MSKLHEHTEIIFYSSFSINIIFIMVKEQVLYSYSCMLAFFVLFSTATVIISTSHIYTEISN